MTRSAEDPACGCYGCTIERKRAGILAPDRSAEPCVPPCACATHGRCWMHSEWVDEVKGVGKQELKDAT